MRKGEYWDDVTGVPVKQELVMKARKEDMQDFAKHGVYTKVPEKDCWEATGKGPIGVRWVDINKGMKTGQSIARGWSPRD